MFDELLDLDAIKRISVTQNHSTDVQKSIPTKSSVFLALSLTRCLAKEGILWDAGMWPLGLFLRHGEDIIAAEVSMHSENMDCFYNMF